MHAFGFQPGFQIFAGIGAELDEHFSFEHVDEDAFGMSEPSSLHALGESFGSLAREASERVLREVAWHRNSCVRIGVSVFHRRQSICTSTQGLTAAVECFLKTEFPTSDNAGDTSRISMGTPALHIGGG